MIIMCFLFAICMAFISLDNYFAIKEKLNEIESEPAVPRNMHNTNLEEAPESLIKFLQEKLENKKAFFKAVVNNKPRSKHSQAGHREKLHKKSLTVPQEEFTEVAKIEQNIQKEPEKEEKPQLLAIKEEVKECNIEVKENVLSNTPIEAKVFDLLVINYIIGRKKK